MPLYEAVSPRSTIRLTPSTIAAMPSAATAGAGTQGFVTDALAPVSLATVVAGGAINTPVYSDGTNWKVG